MPPFGLLLLYIAVAMASLTYLPTHAMIESALNNPEAGLIYFEEGKVLQRIGTYHINIKTNLRPKIDIIHIDYYLKKFTHTCKDVQNKLNTTKQKTRCNPQSHHIRRLSNELKNDINFTIYKAENNKRTKRNTQDSEEDESEDENLAGQIWHVATSIWHAVFGSTNHHHKSHQNSMGTVIHSMEALKSFETQVIDKQTGISKAFTDLTHDIDKYRLDDTLDRNIEHINAQLTEAKDLIIENIHQLRDVYIHEDHAMNDTEWKTLISKANVNITEGQIAPLSIYQLKKLATLDIEMTDDEKSENHSTINFIFGLPVVNKKTFDKLFVFALPHFNKTTTPDVEPHSIYVQYKQKGFLKDPKLISINESIYMTEDTITIINEPDKNTDCTIKHLFNQNETCPMKALQMTFDEWIQIPHHNTVAYYSNVPKFLKCQNTKMEIVKRVDIIQIPKGCMVTTPTKKILASYDGSKSQKFAFKFDLPEPDMEIEVMKTETTNISLPQSNNDLSLTDNTLLEAKMKNSNNGNIPEWIIILLVASISILMVLLIMIVVGVYIWMKKTQK